MTEPAGPGIFDSDAAGAAQMAQGYEDQMVPMVFLPWAEDLVERLDVRAGERALDVACGTGAAARVLAGRVGPQGEVVGIDQNPFMLEVARSLGLRNLELRHGDAAALPFEDEEFDLVVCQQGLQFLPEPALAVAEMERVLRPGGRLGLACWNDPADNPAASALLAAAEAVGWTEGATGYARAFSLGDEPKLARLLDAAGLETVSLGRQERVAVMADVPGWISGFLEGPPFGPEYQSAEPVARTEFLSEALGHLERYSRGATHEIPWAATVAVAAKPA